MSRVAVVTGGASGIGLGVAQKLVEHGKKVAVLDRDGAAAERAAKELSTAGAKTLAVEADVTDRATVAAAMDEVRAELGPIEIIVTSAGRSALVPFMEMTLEQWEETVAINLTGTFNSLQAVVPDMVAAGWGRIVTISSSSAQSGAARMTHYSAAKGGVIALTKSLAVELGPHGITVNTVPPPRSTRRGSGVRQRCPTPRPVSPARRP